VEEVVPIHGAAAHRHGISEVVPLSNVAAVHHVLLGARPIDLVVDDDGGEHKHRRRQVASRDRKDSR